MASVDLRQTIERACVLLVREVDARGEPTSDREAYATRHLHYLLDEGLSFLALAERGATNDTIIERGWRDTEAHRMAYQDRSQATPAERERVRIMARNLFRAQPVVMKIGPRKHLTTRTAGPILRS
jgi:hypothetical protein